MKEIEMNLYETLGVERSSTTAEIKKAYKKAASLNHPDKEGGCPDKMADINLAYEVLSDTGRREAYNRNGETSKQPNLFDQAVGALTHRLSALMQENQYKPINYFDKLSKELEDNINQSKQAMKQLRSDIVKLQYLVENCVIKNEIMKGGLQSHLDKMNFNLEKLNEQEPIFDLSRQILEECEYTGELPDPRQVNISNYFTSSSS